MMPAQDRMSPTSTVLPRIHGHTHIYVTEIPPHANIANQKVLTFCVGKSVNIYVTLACQSKKTENRTKEKGSFLVIFFIFSHF